MLVNEIFYSLQGEGTFTGMPAVFLRLAGCNLRCPFCDTAYEGGEELTEGEILARVREYPSRNIVVTGGEPLLSLTASLTHALKAEGFTIHLETNGTLPLPLDAHVDWVTCSPKDGRLPTLSRIDELKVVYWGQDITPYETPRYPLRSLQPLHTGDPSRDEEVRSITIDYILTHPTWRLSLQTHKILGMP